MQLGLAATGFDRNRGATQDLDTPEGWENARNLALRIKFGGVAWFAVECSTYVFTTFYRHNRKAGFHEEGDAAQPDVRAANRLARRVIWLAQLLWSRGVHLVFETPLKSIMPEVPIFAPFFRSIGLQSTRSHQCMFADTEDVSSSKEPVCSKR